MKKLGNFFLQKIAYFSSSSCWFSGGGRILWRFLKLKNMIWALPPCCICSIRSREGMSTEFVKLDQCSEATAASLGNFILFMWLKFIPLTDITGEKKKKVELLYLNTLAKYFSISTFPEDYYYYYHKLTNIRTCHSDLLIFVYNLG